LRQSKKGRFITTLHFHNGTGAIRTAELYWNDGRQFKAALTLYYDSGLQNELITIIATIGHYGAAKLCYLSLMETITWDDFERIDIRAGTIIEAQDFPNARKPSYQLLIDFGPLGMKRSSAQITVLYSKEELIGKQVVAVVNFPVKQIANFFSECLVLGVYGTSGEVTLLQPENKVENGGRIG